MRTSRLLTVGLLMILIGLFSSANAALQDNGDGTVTQVKNDGSTLMWLQDANYAMTSGYDSNGYMNWSNAVTWADNLLFAGYDNWRLPSTLVPDSSCTTSSGSGLPNTGLCSGSEMGSLFWDEGITAYPDPSSPFNNVGSAYWSGTADSSNSAYMFFFGVHTPWTSGDQDVFNSSFGLRAWAVRDISPAVVPEPISSSLFILGGTLLAGRRYLRRKKIA